MARPLKYKSADELATAIAAYFKHCEENRWMPNKAGLCYELKLSREAYNEYKKRFDDAIKGVQPILDAEKFIENAWVQRLAGTTPTGAIFYLKNAFSADYRDRIETDVTSKGEKVQGFQYITPDGHQDPANA